MFHFAEEISQSGRFRSVWAMERHEVPVLRQEDAGNPVFLLDRKG